jgi:hypothetical protein
MRTIGMFAVTGMLALAAVPASAQTKNQSAAEVADIAWSPTIAAGRAAFTLDASLGLRPSHAFVSEHVVDVCLRFAERKEVVKKAA